MSPEERNKLLDGVKASVQKVSLFVPLLSVIRYPLLHLLLLVFLWTVASSLISAPCTPHSWSLDETYPVCIPPLKSVISQFCAAYSFIGQSDEKNEKCRGRFFKQSSLSGHLRHSRGLQWEQQHVRTPSDTAETNHHPAPSCGHEGVSDAHK